MDDLQKILNIPVAQYTFESKQIRNYASNFVLRQQHGIEGTGQRINAGMAKNADQLHQLIQRDYTFKFMKNVRGSPAYFQQTFYDLLAMIRQLDIPTWFLTLSAPDMKWPDVIQCIAYQYSQTFTEEQVKNMTFQEKSKWLQSNPVTVARHFHYRLNTFFQKFLKSCANPLGKLTDYAIRIEFQACG